MVGMFSHLNIIVKDINQKMTKEDPTNDQKKELEGLQNQNLLLRELHNLKDISTYRYQRLVIEERKMLALERQAIAMEKLATQTLSEETKK